ncbi:hypothetical protein [Candidatus Proelusimicrobium excrementi]|uniref:hypothetical protein n=1 Tax=Candidatus Proelusimicrobium excrementi TaxID=3416222 RepID=UPI003C90D8F2|nr:hypothetical protein [Elusimicrobiaceae bacterium]
MDEILKYWPFVLATVAAVLAWGDIKGELKVQKNSLENLQREFKADMARLEAKQDKYNHLQERTTRTEESLKSAHKRLNEVEERVHEYHH